MLSDYSFDESVLTSKQLTAFSQSATLFESWAEEHSPAEIQAAIIELNAFKAKNDAAIDEQIARQRDETTTEQTIQDVNRQVQEQFVRENPWFPLEPQVREVNARILWERTLALAQGEGTDLYPVNFSDEGLESFGNEIMRLLRKAAQQIWNERRFYGVDFSAPHVHTPFSLFEPNSDPALDLKKLPSNEQIDQMLDEGTLSMDELKDAANAQLAAEAESRGEVPQADTEMAISNRRPAPEKSASRGDRGFAALMFGSSVDPARR
jgi:hypothetical protein